MAAELEGRTVGVLQTRNADVLTSLLERRGARVVTAPVLREETIEDHKPLRRALAEVAAAPLDLAIFQTGVGAARLFDLAAESGQEAALRRRLAEGRVLARGPKPLNALLQRDVSVALRTVEPHTTAQVLSAVESDLAGKTVLVQHHGARNDELIEALAARGAHLIEVHTYRWALPDDLGPCLALLAELDAGRLDATVFTSAAQVVNLFAIAEHSGRAASLAEALRARTRLASIGPTTSAALAEHALAPAIQPERPKMAPLVEAIARSFSATEA